MESPERYPEVLGELYATLFPREGRSIEAPEFVPPRPLGCKSEAPERLSLQAPPYPDDPALLADSGQSRPQACTFCTHASVRLQVS